MYRRGLFLRGGLDVWDREELELTLVEDVVRMVHGRVGGTVRDMSKFDRNVAQKRKSEQCQIDTGKTHLRFATSFWIIGRGSRSRSVLLND